MTGEPEGIPCRAQDQIGKPESMIGQGKDQVSLRPSPGGGVGPDPIPPTWAELKEKLKGWRQISMFQAGLVSC